MPVAHMCEPTEPAGETYISRSFTRREVARYGKRTLDENPAVCADTAGGSNTACLHSTHKSVLAARLAPERLVCKN